MRSVHKPTYTSWKAAKLRCHNPNHNAYAYYGGRGILVCARWHTFENFLADMGERPDGFSLDRIDNDKGYEPGNCRWATTKEQHRNRRNNVRYEFRGQSLTLGEISDLTGIAEVVIRRRLQRGWDLDLAAAKAVNTYLFKSADVAQRSDPKPQSQDLSSSMRALHLRKEALLEAGLSLDEIANRVPRSAA